MLDRLINIFFLFALVFLFLLVANADDHLRIVFGIVGAALFAYTAFMLNWLTLDGVHSGLLFGVIAFGIGGLTGAVIVLSFFISSSILSKDLISEEAFMNKKFRRDGLQVWSNGFWFAFWIMIWFMTDEFAFQIAAISCISFATSDTWASEIGERNTVSKVRLITTLEKVPSGRDGGISLKGTFAGLLGAMFIGGVFWLISEDLSVWALLIVVASGFLGSFIDSLFGATIQGKEFSPLFKTLFARQISYVDNNTVNWLAAGSASALSLLALLFVGL